MHAHPVVDADAGLGVGDADVDVQGEGRLAASELAHRSVDELVALAAGDGDLLPDGERVRPGDRRAQMIYFRGGNSASEMVVVVLTRDGKPMRTFPIGAKGAVHVPLVVVEDLEPETRLELLVAAPSGTGGTLALDVGLVEI